MFNPPPPLRIAQLSDFHLFADPRDELLGINTQASMEAVLEQALDDRPDLVLATGDLSQDGSPASYRRLGTLLGRLSTPVCCLPGNHDGGGDGASILDACGARMGPTLVEERGWSLILLDSTRPGEAGGSLSDEDLAFLQRALERAIGRHVLVALHHHPVPMHSAWLDAQQVDTGEQLFAVLAADPRVRAVVWGHVHQEYQGERDGIRLFAVPSTCVQFRPGSAEFAVDDRSPGYRWLELHDDGRIDSVVRRLHDDRFRADARCRGYDR